MKYENFSVYHDDGTLIETVPAIITPASCQVNVTRNSTTGNFLFNNTVTLTAQVPSTTTSVELLNADTGATIATVTPVNGIAEFEITVQSPGTLRVRVGPETVTKMNEAVVVGYED